MSKIPTLPAQGSQRNINVPGSTPNGGVNPSAPPVQPGWNPHDAIAASGQRNGVPAETVAAPDNAIPGKPLNYPAHSAPVTLEVAGRDGAGEREDGRGGHR